VVIAVAQAPPGFVRGVQDLSCTGRDLGVAVCIAVGVAQALTPHGEKWSSGLGPQPVISVGRYAGMHRPSSVQRLRLTPAAYRSGLPFLVTLVTLNRRPLFVPSKPEASGLQALLERRCADSRLYAWVIMPDHVHVLLTTIDVVLWVHRLKAAATRSSCVVRGSRGIWQASFHDRALRSSDSLAAVARYIWLNPVRAGLTPTAAAHPASGSTEWPDWREWVDDPFAWSKRS